MSNQALTTVREELQGNSVTLATTGDPASGWLARVAQGCVGLGLQVTAAEPPKGDMRCKFNNANAGIEAQGPNLVAAGAQPAPVAPAAPEQTAPIAPTVTTPGLG